MDLNLILRRCRAGDELAWEALVRQYQSRVYGISYCYMGNAEEARDVAQEIFVRIYRNLSACTEASLFLPWLIRISRNTCVDYLRRRKARPPAQDVSALELSELHSQEPNPEEQWISQATRNRICRALQSIGQLSRELIILKEIQGLPLKEIASLLSIPMGTVKSRSHRARLELARQLLAQGR